MTRLMLIPFLTVVLSACAPKVYQLDQAASSSSRIVVTDQRPDWQKTRKLGSLSISSCDYATKRYADEETSPGRIQYLNARLAQAFETRLGGKEVKVLTFTVFDNAQAGQRKQFIEAALATVTPGLAVPTAPAAAYACELDREGGGFSASENPTYQPVGIGNLEIEIDGKRYRARAVEPARQDGPTVIRRTVAETVDRLIEAIRPDWG